MMLDRLIDWFWCVVAVLAFLAGIGGLLLGWALIVWAILG